MIYLSVILTLLNFKKEKMEELISRFPEQLEESIQIAKTQKFALKDKTINNVVISGLGGSGIGAKIVSQWVENEIKVPVVIVQNYSIPNFIDENTLVIGSSYSGNTEETIISLLECQKKKATIVGISSGGELEVFCKVNHFNFVKLPGGFPPRAALAYSVIQILNVLNQFGLITDQSLRQLEECPDFLRSDIEKIKSTAYAIADFINDTNAVIYAESTYECVAIRGKQQFNENSKFLCRYHTIPEMNHNELLGWGCGSDKHAALFLRTTDTDQRNLKRFELTAEIIKTKTDNVLFIDGKGVNRIENSIYLIHILDWASYYLGIKRNEDIMEIEMINFLKSELAKV